MGRQILRRLSWELLQMLSIEGMKWRWACRWPINRQTKAVNRYVVANSRNSDATLLT